MKISFSKLMLSFLIVGWSALSLCSCASEETTRVPAKMSLENADEMGLSTITFSNRSKQNKFPSRRTGIGTSVSLRTVTG